MTRFMEIIFWNIFVFRQKSSPGGWQFVSSWAVSDSEIFLSSFLSEYDTSMKFRQRLAWLGVILYLSASFGFVYYIFEISEHFNSYALEHVQNYHGDSAISLSSSFWQHVTDIPMAVWLLFFLLPYLQIFGMLLAGTRAEPWRSTAFLWPGIVFNKWQKLYKRLTGHTRQSKPINSTFVFNGHVVIDTWFHDADKYWDLIELKLLYVRMHVCVYVSGEYTNVCI